MFTVCCPKRPCDIWRPRRVKQIASSSVPFQLTFDHFDECVKRLLDSKTMSHHSWKNCQDDGVANINTFLAKCWFPFILVKAQIAHPSVIIEVPWGVWEHFYFLLRPLSVYPWSPPSQLRLSSSIGQLKSLWHIAESKDLEKSRSWWCVFISFSLK